jgi:hypothetical protein
MRPSPQLPASQPTTGDGNHAPRRFSSASVFRVMRERDWRQLYIRGKTPEDAARQAETAYYNTRPAFDRIRHPPGYVPPPHPLDVVGAFDVGPRRLLG